eukprot:5451939-Prymnesium_polylepis.1
MPALHCRTQLVDCDARCAILVLHGTEWVHFWGGDQDLSSSHFFKTLGRGTDHTHMDGFQPKR